MGKHRTHANVDRLAATIRERRRNIGQSRRALSEVSEVSESTIVRIESGVRVRPAKLMRVALALSAFEACSAPKAKLEERRR